MSYVHCCCSRSMTRLKFISLTWVVCNRETTWIGLVPFWILVRKTEDRQINRTPNWMLRKYESQDRGGTNSHKIQQNSILLIRTILLLIDLLLMIQYCNLICVKGFTIHNHKLYVRVVEVRNMSLTVYIIHTPMKKVT